MEATYRTSVAALAAAVVLMTMGPLANARSGTPATTAATNCAPAVVEVICASADAGVGISCDRGFGQVWCQGGAGVGGSGWSPIGLGPGTVVWSGSASASWACTGVCECPSYADCVPTKADGDTCGWSLGSFSGCSVGRGFSLPIVFAWEGTCITYTVSAWSSTTATNGLATSAGEPDADTTTFC